jgi:hypothetical protein
MARVPACAEERKSVADVAMGKHPGAHMGCGCASGRGCPNLAAMVGRAPERSGRPISACVGANVVMKQGEARLSWLFVRSARQSLRHFFVHAAGTGRQVWADEVAMTRPIAALTHLRGVA